MRRPFLRKATRRLFSRSDAGTRRALCVRLLARPGGGRGGRAPAAAAAGSQWRAHQHRLFLMLCAWGGWCVRCALSWHSAAFCGRAILENVREWLENVRERAECLCVARRTRRSPHAHARHRLTLRSAARPPSRPPARPPRSAGDPAAPPAAPARRRRVQFGGAFPATPRAPGLGSEAVRGDGLLRADGAIRADQLALRRVRRFQPARECTEDTHPFPSPPPSPSPVPPESPHRLHRALPRCTAAIRRHRSRRRRRRRDSTAASARCGTCGCQRTRRASPPF